MTPPDEGVDTDDSKWVNLQDDALGSSFYNSVIHALLWERSTGSFTALAEILHSQNPDMGAVWCVRPRTLCRAHRSTGRWFGELGNSPVRHERLVISFCLASLVLSCCTLMYFYFKMLPLNELLSIFMIHSFTVALPYLLTITYTGKRN